jgi:hypothetical protein
LQMWSSRGPTHFVRIEIPQRSLPSVLVAGESCQLRLSDALGV